jgi:hypothetical protein
MKPVQTFFKKKNKNFIAEYFFIGFAASLILCKKLSSFSMRKSSDN